MTTLQQIQQAIQEKADAEKVVQLQRYFKTGKGQYGADDVFMGVKVPDQRNIAKTFYKETTLQEVEVLLQTNIHEYRLTALFILVLQFNKSKSEKEKETIVKTYLANLLAINNWDLVDSSAPYLLGTWLYNKPRSLLYQFAESGNLWKQRIAIVTTYYFLKKDAFEDTIAIAKVLLHHKHDLIHKATGWMLREMGNRNGDVAMVFLVENYQAMPRTMLRYAIEKLPENMKQQFLKGTI